MIKTVSLPEVSSSVANHREHRAVVSLGPDHLAQITPQATHSGGQLPTVLDTCVSALWTAGTRVAAAAAVAAAVAAAELVAVLTARHNDRGLSLRRG